MSDFANETEMTVGQILRAARTTGRRKRELNTLARLLCIKEEFLDALENDDFAKIGELVYILGFARNYAMELDLDPYVVVDKIKKQMGFLEEEDAVEIEGEESTGIQEKAPRPSKFGNWLRGKAKIILVCLMIAAALGGAAVVVSINVSRKPAPEPAAEITAGTKFRIPAAREYGLKNKDYSQVVLQAVGTTWIQIKNAAGTVVFEHSMTAGDVYYALNGSTATIGNAAALDVWVNGREIPQLCAEHQRILDIPLSPEGLAK